VSVVKRAQPNTCSCDRLLSRCSHGSEARSLKKSFKTLQCYTGFASITSENSACLHSRKRTNRRKRSTPRKSENSASFEASSAVQLGPQGLRHMMRRWARMPLADAIEHQRSCEESLSVSLLYASAQCMQQKVTSSPRIVSLCPPS
jgi:hypothetical protein